VEAKTGLVLIFWFYTQSSQIFLFDWGRTIQQSTTTSVTPLSNNY